MKKLKQHKRIIILGLVIIGFVFYWYAVRPPIIKHNCSWVSHHTDIIPAILAMTPEQIQIADIADAEQSACKAINKGLFDCLDSGRFGRVNRWEPKPAIPARDWEEKATPSEYQFCLHNHGI